MPIWTQVQYIELFHLLLLAHLEQTLDKRFHALKGGCNFRFFFRSLRYSEDMDFDVQTLTVDEVRSRVNRVLASKSFRQSLAVRDMEIEHVTEAKQTQTTQRWKFGVRTPASSTPAPTKVEFSRRGLCNNSMLETVDSLLLRMFGLPPLLASHYPADEAWNQKVGALAHRSVAQARDIFDLHLLLASGMVDGAHATRGIPPETIREAQRRCLSVSFDDFKGQVLSYLTPDHQAAYDTEAVWDDMALRVSETLGGSA